MKRIFRVLLLAVFLTPTTALGFDPAGEIGSAGQSGAEFGKSVSCNYSSTFAVGAPLVDDGGFTNVGRVYMYTGLNDTSPTFINYIDSPASNINFGQAVVFVDPVSVANDSDAGQELIITAPGASGGGLAYVHYSSGFATKPKGDLWPTSGGAKFGAAAGQSADIDNDGFRDVVVGDPDANGGDGYIEFFNINVDTASAGVPNSIIAVSGPAGSGERLGSAFALMSDVTGDFKEELAVGSPGWNNRGRVRVLRGSDASFYQTFDGNVPNRKVGAALATLPDLNSDGANDLLVGAPGIDGTTGAAYVLSGANINNIICTIQPGDRVGRSFGASVAAVGDYNGDGFEEFVIGAPLLTESLEDDFTNQGAIFVYHYDDTQGRCFRVQEITGEQPGRRFGRSLSSGKCNLNADTRADLVVGSLLEQQGSPGSIQMFVGNQREVPNQANFEFRISRAGAVQGLLNFDVPPNPRCNVELLGRYTVGAEISKLFRLGNGFSEDTEFGLLANNMPHVDKQNGEKPVMHLAFETRCAGSVIRSNVFARYMTCGQDQVVTPDEYMQILRDKIAVHDIVQDNSAFVNLKRIGKKKRRRRKLRAKRKARLKRKRTKGKRRRKRRRRA